MDQTLQTIQIISSMMTGSCLSIIRVQEPYFKFLIKKKVLARFGIEVTEHEPQPGIHAYSINDSLSAFLHSSLNVELVHVILESITKHTEDWEQLGEERLD